MADNRERFQTARNLAMHDLSKDFREIIALSMMHPVFHHDNTVARKVEMDAKANIYIDEDHFASLSDAELEQVLIVEARRMANNPVVVDVVGDAEVSLDAVDSVPTVS
jgi:hypothetical protein